MANTELELEPIAGPETEVETEVVERSADDLGKANSDLQSPISNTQSNTITFKRSHFYAAIAPVTFVLGLAAGYLLWGVNPPSQEAPKGALGAQAAAVPAAPTPIRRFDVSVDNDPALGTTDAPITIIEFSDFECPFCQRFHQQTFRALLEAYPNQILYVYRDFPLTSIHPNAQLAAEAAQCAHEQGRFWEYHDVLFQNQEHLGNPDLYTEAARTLDLDVSAFTDCVQSGRYTDEVNADFNAGREVGITGTPTFFINGRPLVGAQPLEAFVAVIEEELAAAR